MRNRIKDVLKQETELVDLKMSKKLIETPIQEKQDVEFAGVNEFETSKPKQKRNLMRFAMSCVCVLMVVITSICLVFKTTNQASALTSYIIEINPSICITTDEEDTVVGLFSLNEDGDDLIADEAFENFSSKKFDEILKTVAKLSIEKGFINNESPTNQQIKFMVTNNKKSFAKDKGEHAREIFEQKLKEDGFFNYRVDAEFLSVDKFGNKIGFDKKFVDLDKFKDDIMKKPKFFDPNFMPPPPPQI